jgi:hypothetical protein
VLKIGAGFCLHSFQWGQWGSILPGHLKLSGFVKKLLGFVKKSQGILGVKNLKF